MPELPEVESIRRHLEQGLANQPAIRRMQFFRSDLRTAMPLHLHRQMRNEKILSIRRRAKFLLFATERRVLISHLGMSGSWRLAPSLERRPHDHIAVEFISGLFLIYHDPRRFGVFEESALGQEHKNRWLEHLGVEPESAEWSAEYLLRHSRGRSAPIKNLLLNQRIVAGLGNIYVAEALFLAGVRPTRMAKKITAAEAAKIIQHSRQILLDAMAFGGTTLRDYVRPDGQSGAFKQQLMVYDRAGSQCRVCATANIKRIVQSARSTYYCPSCQR
jgi:formamidopyrimidine-DNA glycosylase